MCAACGRTLTLADLRVRSITRGGCVEVEHDTAAGRCGPVIVDGLVATPSTQAMRRHNPLVRALIDRTEEAEARATVAEARATAAEAMLAAFCDLGTSPIDFWARVNAYQTHLIAWAMDRAHGNRSHAARLLGLCRTTLFRIQQRATTVALRGAA